MRSVALSSLSWGDGLHCVVWSTLCTGTGGRMIIEDNRVFIIIFRYWLPNDYLIGSH